jgi:hypothetical protein
MFAPDGMFWGFTCVFAVVAGVVLLSMVLHTAVFGTVFYTILQQLRLRSQALKPRACAHCGTVRTETQLTCPQCGAPFDVGSPPTV